MTDDFKPGDLIYAPFYDKMAQTFLILENKDERGLYAYCMVHNPGDRIRVFKKQFGSFDNISWKKR